MKNYFPNISEWIVKNFWNLFGVVGVLGTFYFSLFYVPGYVKQLYTAKSNVIHESLMDNVQELIFYDQDVDADDIETLIKGKELDLNAKYPFTVNELLIQVQEKFMGNKFVPLDKRKKLIEKIDELRKELSPVEKVETKINWKLFLPWIMSGLGMFISVLGAVSLSKKIKRDKEVEVDIACEDDEKVISHNYFPSQIKISAIEYENLIGKIITELGAQIIEREKIGPGQPVSGPDYIIRSSNGDEFIVECKRFRHLVGLGTMRQFLHQVFEHGKKGIFVSASGLTQRSLEAIYNHNTVNTDTQIFLVQGTNKDSLKMHLKNIINNKTSNNGIKADS